jgi:DNA mismatch endonuclease, patch repair protein
MAKVGGRDTTPERAVRSVIHRLGCRFGLHRKDLPGTPDIVMPARRAVVFVHGCFWHGHDCRRGRRPTSNTAFWNEKLEKNKLRDLRDQSLLRDAGWRVLTVWECETKVLPALREKLADALKVKHNPTTTIPRQME